MPMRTKLTALSPMNGGPAGNGGGGGNNDVGDWEIRPGGMLVQKREPDSDRNSVPPPTIRVRVKYGSTYHEIHISSQATFGELKKLLAGTTGLHHEDQKLLFKDKERSSKSFLDTAGVKDRSKIVLVEDPISQEKRLLEMRRNAKMERASKTISEISLEVDRLAGQVSALESVISKGGKVAETSVLNVIELLMNQLIKLDGIFVDGDVKLQRKMQVIRVQKYVETLDVLKIKNSMPSNNGNASPMPNQPRHSNGQRINPIQHQQQPRHFVGQSPIQIHQHQKQQPSRNSTPVPVVTTKWETFDPSPARAPLPLPSTSKSVNPVQSKFNWEFFE